MFSQSKDDNFFSHKNDKEIIESVLDSLKNPKSLESLFLKSNNGNYKSLGFNYKIYSSIIYRKKLVITCDFLYLKDSLISYVLKPKLPNSKRLQKKHLKYYEKEVLKKRKTPRDITNEQIESYMDENNWS